MICKIHKLKEKTVAAVCDGELIGRIFKENGLELDIDEGFYKGENMDKKEVLKEVMDADIVNIVGEKAINLALDNNIILKSNIIKIKGVPHAQRI